MQVRKRVLWVWRSWMRVVSCCVLVSKSCVALRRKSWEKAGPPIGWLRRLNPVSICDSVVLVSGCYIGECLG